MIELLISLSEDSASGFRVFFFFLQQVLQQCRPLRLHAFSRLLSATGGKASNLTEYSIRGGSGRFQTGRPREESKETLQERHVAKQEIKHISYYIAAVIFTRLQFPLPPLQRCYAM